jgi:hypothetical protein
MTTMICKRSNQGSTATRRGGRTRRPELEWLEDRCLLAVNFTTEPVIPVIDAATKAHLQGVFLRGIQAGNRPDVFSKVGDSITATPFFLVDLGGPAYNPFDPLTTGAYLGLAPTIAYFRAEPVDALGNNSFNHASFAAFPGWTSSIVLGDGGVNSPLLTELNATHPAVALIMIGTNDQYLSADLNSFAGRITAIATLALDHGVIPVLSTIPDYFYLGGQLEGRALAYNQIIAEVAATLDVPLWNYWLAMQPLPNKGISSDTVHPSVSPLGSGNFTPEGLIYGFNVRNLTAVEVLAKIQQVVMENGAPDQVGTAPSPQTLHYVTGLYQAILGRGPDPIGLAAWAQAIQGGASGAQVAQALWDSPEHRAQEVASYYGTYLHRNPQPGEITFWVGVFQGGATETDVQGLLLTSPEYQAAHPDDAAFIQGLYQDVLGRPLDQAGALLWTSDLKAGRTRALVAQDFLTSPEKNREIIDGYFANFLGRAADPGGELALLTMVLENGVPLEGVAEMILGSVEFAVRFP